MPYFSLPGSIFSHYTNDTYYRYTQVQEVCGFSGLVAIPLESVRGWCLFSAPSRLIRLLKTTLVRKEGGFGGPSSAAVWPGGRFLSLFEPELPQLNHWKQPSLQNHLEPTLVLLRVVSPYFHFLLLVPSFSLVKTHREYSCQSLEEGRAFSPGTQDFTVPRPCIHLCEPSSVASGALQCLFPSSPKEVCYFQHPDSLSTFTHLEVVDLQSSWRAPHYLWAHVMRHLAKEEDMAHGFPFQEIKGNYPLFST